MLSQESKEKMKLWLSLWPESGHAEDEKRKNDFINSLNANNEIKMRIFNHMPTR